MIEPWWVAVVSNAALVGSAWGHLRAGQKQNAKDIGSIKRALGLENGQPGAFLRREIYEESEAARKDRLLRLEDELAALRARTD